MKNVFSNILEFVYNYWDIIIIPVAFIFSISALNWLIREMNNEKDQFNKPMIHK